ncbi:MAG: hypothetical protein FJX76_04650 [Armatimonadetes bacterium]|nr:hypothetical protein [Armatimonadota bacterium]
MSRIGTNVQRPVNTEQAVQATRQAPRSAKPLSQQAAAKPAAAPRPINSDDGLKDAVKSAASAIGGGKSGGREQLKVQFDKATDSVVARDKEGKEVSRGAAGNRQIHVEKADGKFSVRFGAKAAAPTSNSTSARGAESVSQSGAEHRNEAPGQKAAAAAPPAESPVGSILDLASGKGQSAEHKPEQAAAGAENAAEHKPEQAAAGADNKPEQAVGNAPDLSGLTQGRL